jgi:hypothetical protein
LPTFVPASKPIRECPAAAEATDQRTARDVQRHPIRPTVIPVALSEMVFFLRIKLPVVKISLFDL